MQSLDYKIDKTRCNLNATMHKNKTLNSIETEESNAFA